MHLRTFAPLAAFALLVPTATAQWSPDPSANLSVGDGPSDQVQPKLAATADGGVYVSWFDGIANGYDVRLQRLDAGGVEQWPHNGVLVADRGFTSTQDYGLGLHASGDALLAFRDDRSGSVQITAQRVRQDGSLAWGPLGIQLTNTNAFVTAPKIVGTGDGEVVVAWREDLAAYVARLDADGVPVWANPVQLLPGAGNYTPSDLVAAGTGSILSIVHQTGSSFGAPRHLRAQKHDASGAPLWGAQPLAVFDGGSLQIGNFPTFVGDGAGGAVFSWYGVSPLQCYAQRVLANGALAFPHNGVAASANTANVRVSPSAAFDAASGSVYLFWKEQNALQSQSGLFGQRFDAAGAPQWGANGQSFVPVGSVQVDWVRVVNASPGSVYVFWIASAGFGQDTGNGLVADASGAQLVPPTLFASTPSGKTRLAAARAAGGDALLAWGDSAVDAGDVLAQNFREDGSLGTGAVPYSAYCFGAGCPCGNDAPLHSPEGCLNSTGAGAQLVGEGMPSVTADTFVLRSAGAPAGVVGLFFQGNQALAGSPFGDGLRCAGGGVIRLVTVVTDVQGCAASDGSCGAVLGGSPGSIAAHPDQSAPLTPGTVKRYQHWYRDPVGGPCGSGFNFSNGLEVLWQG